MAREEGAGGKEVLKVSKKDDEKTWKLEDEQPKDRPRDDQRDRAREDSWDKDRDSDRDRDDRDRWERDRGEHDRDDYPPPPSKPLFSSENIYKLMALGLLIGIILLFIGGMLTAGAMYMKPKDEGGFDTQRVLYASGVLIDSIGLFLMAIFLVIPLLIVKDLNDKQRTLIIILAAAVIVGFVLLTIHIGSASAASIPEIDIPEIPGY